MPVGYADVTLGELAEPNNYQATEEWRRIKRIAPKKDLLIYFEALYS